MNDFTTGINLASKSEKKSSKKKSFSWDLKVSAKQNMPISPVCKRLTMRMNTNQKVVLPSSKPSFAGFLLGILETQTDKFVIALQQ